MSESAGEPAIEVVGFGYTFPGRERPTLEDVSFQIPTGSFTVVTGRTGSGKSTLLRALVGLIPHLARGRMTGEVRLFGRDTSDAAAAELAATIGFVLQSPDDQICTTTVATELAFGLENLGLPADEISRRIAETAERFGLADRFKHATATLSGGLKQRLVLAAVVAMRPRILVCDEPLSRLDPPAAGALLDELRRLQAAGLTIVVAEHRLDDLLPLADRVITLDDGRLSDSTEAETQPTIPTSIRRNVGPGDDVMLRASDLTFRYSPKLPTVWSNVSFDIRRGERIALVGPNGAGKSTLAATLAGVVPSTSGRIVWQGESTKLQTVLVPQQVDLTLFNCTVFDELAYGPRQFRLSAEVVDERVRQTAAMLGLEECLDDAPHALSQGRRVRTAIAAALATVPRLLLLDEPTTGQDAPTMRQIMDSLSTVVGSPGGPEALLFTTHDLQIAARYADRVFVLCDGTLTADVSPRRLLDDFGLLERAGLKRGRA